MNATASTEHRVQKGFQFKFDRNWGEHGYSYFTTPDCDHVRFACRFCDKDITDDYKHHHCWDCMSKYCDECWFKHEYGFHPYEVTSGCPNDRLTKPKSSF